MTGTIEYQIRETPQTPEEIAKVVLHGPIDDLRWLPIGLSLAPPEGVDVESLCLRLSRHGDVWVRGNAFTALGHLARVTGELDAERVKPVLMAGLKDESDRVCGCAADAISDIRIFMGWKFRQTRPRARPPAPRTVNIVVAWRVWLIIDEESNLLVERGGSDPRGLSPASAWRLPGRNLMRPATEAAQKLEDMWEERSHTVWINESNMFNEQAVVKTSCLEGGEDADYGDAQALHVRAWLTDRHASPWPMAEGIEQRWLSIEDFMVEHAVGAADRYALALFNQFYFQQTGAWFYS